MKGRKRCQQTDRTENNVNMMQGFGDKYETVCFRTMGWVNAKFK